MKLKTLIIARIIVLIFAVISIAVPLFEFAKNRATKADKPEEPSLAWAALTVPADWRLEVPRQPKPLQAVRWESSLNETGNGERYGVLKAHAAEQPILTGQLQVESVSEIHEPFGDGLAIIGIPTAKVGKNVKNPFRIIVYTKLADPRRTDVLQEWVDGKFPRTIDFAQLNAVPISREGNLIRAVAASNSPYSSAWDWSVESAKLKSTFAKRIVEAKSQDEINAIRAEIDAKKKEGFEL